MNNNVNIFSYRILFGDTFTVNATRPGQRRYTLFMNSLKRGWIPFNQNAKRLWILDDIYRCKRQHRKLQVKGTFE